MDKEDTKGDFLQVNLHSVFPVSAQGSAVESAVSIWPSVSRVPPVMKHKRQKHAKKVMTFYEKHFGVVPPYNVLVDSTFVKEALSNKVNIWDQLPKYLCADVRLFTTTCALKELEAFGKLLYGPLKVMREYKVAPCPHQRLGVDPVDCLGKTAKRSHPDYANQQTEDDKKKKGEKLQFFIATQHGTLAEKAKRIPGMPVLYLHGNAVQIEKPSEESKKAAGIVIQDKLVPQHEQERLEALLEQEGLLPEEDGPTHRKRKLKGPNPLASLKKRKRGNLTGVALARHEKRKEMKKWRQVRKRKTGPLGPLEDLMLGELLVEDDLGWKGVIYKRKSIAELQKELENESRTSSLNVCKNVRTIENGH